ncbi:MAG TPA: AAA family ATPase, partial [Candidatus Angelobacter sp.]|nr:AAA family ATPase [Candidatus Angelobacter sp.]
MTDTPDVSPDLRPAGPQAGPPAPALVVPAAGSADDAARAALLALRDEVGKAVIGQDSVVTGLVIALLCRGHVLLEGVPG